VNHEQFIQAINSKSQPWKESRLIYADWLEERGDLRSQYLQTEVAMREPRIHATTKEQLASKLSELAKQIDREWIKSITVIESVKIEHDWAYWISNETLLLSRVRHRVPINSVILYKGKTWNEALQSDSIYTDYYIAKADGAERFNGDKRHVAKEVIAGNIISYIERTGMLPPHVEFVKSFKNGNAHVRYSPSQYDVFNVFLEKEKVGEDVEKLLDRVEPFTPDKAPQEWRFDRGIQIVEESDSPSGDSSDKNETSNQGGEWMIEPAKSGRAKCRTCAQKIEKEELRVGEPTYFEDKLSYRWHHLGCAIHGIANPSALKGLEDLTSEQRARVLK